MRRSCLAVALLSLGCASSIGTALAPISGKTRGAAPKFEGDDLQRLAGGINILEAGTSEDMCPQAGIFTLGELKLGRTQACQDALYALESTSTFEWMSGTAQQVFTRCGFDCPVHEDAVWRNPLERTVPELAAACPTPDPLAGVPGRDQMLPAHYLLLRGLVGEIRSALDGDGSQKALDLKHRYDAQLPNLVACSKAWVQAANERAR